MSVSAAASFLAVNANASRLRAHSCAMQVGADLPLRLSPALTQPDWESFARQREEARARGLTVKEGSATDIPHADESFDVILSTWALHNIPDAAGRARAVHEIARVLAPGGRVLLVDIQHSRAYVRELRAAGLADARRRLASLLFVTPSFRVDASKPFTDPRAP